MNTITLYHWDQHYINKLIDQFQCTLPQHHIVPWSKAISADYLITWKPVDKIFLTKGLKVVFALGAGIDAFLQSKTLNENIPIVRLEEAGMGKQMLEIALYAILHYSRDMITLNRGQRNKQWLTEATPKRLPFSTKVGILGLGQLGGFVATHLARLGYAVSGYSYSLKSLPGVNCYDKNQLTAFLADSEVLINLLPLTNETAHCLNKTLFARLPTGAYLVNIARGGHLVEEDLIPALDNGQLSGAFLDVFKQEPLPETHPFWSDDRITITPHLAAITLQDEAIRQISRNIIAFEDNQPMTGVVDRYKGY
ncbi:MAG: glyoxylate/hydroxypyruvate reductase A [Gammaproteobacteria bacterium]|nr:MAG: glyoxylate/hydroxypyruvate reductase A [Gammaproteobacteria bacterium]